MNILIVSKQNQKCLNAASRLEAVLKKNHKVAFDATTAGKLGRKGMEIESFSRGLIITLGGDGTFIYAAHKARVPILPVRIEGFGYLTTIDFQKLVKNTGMLKKAKMMKRERIKVSGKSVFPLSVNEVMFVKDIPSKIIKLSFEIDSVKFEFKGDGIIFSTPSGSTAYALSAGGSVFGNEIPAIEMVPIFPFNSKLKPMLIPGNKKITVHAESCMMIIDGLKEKRIESEKLVLEKGPPIRILGFGENFFRRYKERFLN